MTRRKIPRVEVDDLVDRARQISGRVRPGREPRPDPDAYVRVVERPSKPPVGRKTFFRDVQQGDDDE